MRRALFLSLLVASASAVSAQDRAETERRLASLQSQIDGVEEQVRRARGEESSAIRAVEGIDAEIQLREELASSYRTQVGTIRQETETLRRSIERLEGEIEAAKRSYRRRARHAYIHGRRNGLALVLAAGSVNQMLVRARYLQQFAQRRRGQVERVAIKTSELRTREQTVRTSLEETQRLLQQRQAEQTRLAERRRDRASLVADLRTRRGRLERELQQRRRDAAALAGLVRDLVAQERRRAEADRAAIAAAEAARQRQAEADAEARAAAAAEAAREAAAERRRLAEEEEEARAAEAQRQADLAARRAREAESFRRNPTPRRDIEPSEEELERQREAAAAQAEADRQAAAAAEAEAERIAAAERRRQAEAEEAAREAEAQRQADIAARSARAAAAEPPPSRTVDLTGSFRQNRGRLPWPVDGTVTGRFGTRTDPVSGTRISSPGIDISTAPGAPTRAVFEGVVQRVGAIPTYGTYVMVTHGEFVTLYGNLSQVAVRQGQRVQAGQAIGRAGTASERRGTQLFFALYQGGSPADPTAWLGRR